MSYQLPRNKHSFSVAVTVSLLMAPSGRKHCCILNLTFSFGLSSSPCSTWPLGELFVFSFLLHLPKLCFSTICHILVHPALELWYTFGFLGFFFFLLSLLIPQVSPTLFVLLHSLVAHSAPCPASQNALCATSCGKAFSCSQTNSFPPFVSSVFIPVSSEMHFKSIDLSGTYHMWNYMGSHVFVGWSFKSNVLSKGSTPCILSRQ